MRIKVTVELDLPADSDPSRLPTFVYLSRTRSLAIVDLLLRDDEDGAPPTVVEPPL